MNNWRITLTKCFGKYKKQKEMKINIENEKYVVPIQETN